MELSPAGLHNCHFAEPDARHPGINADHRRTPDVRQRDELRRSGTIVWMPESA